MIFISLNSKSIYASEEAYRIEKMCIKIFPLSSKTNYAPKGKEKEWFSFMYINSWKFDGKIFFMYSFDKKSISIDV